jgi:hypothetical protein
MANKLTFAKQLPTEKDVEKYKMLVPLLGKMLIELKELSKKKQDGQLNELKVKMVNRVLTQIKDFLQIEPSAEFLDLLDNETLPSNSDAVLILSQFDAALDAYKGKHYGYDRKANGHRWFTKENPPSK